MIIEFLRFLKEALGIILVFIIAIPIMCFIDGCATSGVTSYDDSNGNSFRMSSAENGTVEIVKNDKGEVISVKINNKKEKKKGF